MTSFLISASMNQGRKPYKKTFGNPHRKYHKNPKLCDDVQEEYNQLLSDPNFNSRRILTTLSLKYKIPRTTLINWAKHWQDDQNWKPYDMSVHGNFHLIFSDDQEKSISKYINDNYIEPGNFSIRILLA